jgi:hypothetical protein
LFRFSKLLEPARAAVAVPGKEPRDSTREQLWIRIERM